MRTNREGELEREAAHFPMKTETKPLTGAQDEELLQGQTRVLFQSRMKTKSKRTRRADAGFVREMQQIGFDPRQAEILLEIKQEQATESL